MRSFGSYISKYLVSFAAFILILLFLNAVVFGLTFQKIVTEDYGDSSPQSMLEMTATAATPEQYRMRRCKCSDRIIFVRST